MPEAMPIQHKTRSSLRDLMEAQAGGQELEKVVQTKLLAPPFSQAQRPNPADHKRKRDQPKGKEVVEGGKIHSSKEAEPQKGAKQATTTQIVVEKRVEAQVAASAWSPTMVLDGAPLIDDASIRDFQQGKAVYVADAVEQALLLPMAISDLRSMRKHEAFLSLKRNFALVIQDAYRAKEIVISSYRSMKEEESRRIAVVKVFEVVEKRLQELNAKLTEAEREKKNVEATLERAKRQAKTQRKQVRQGRDELVMAKDQIKALTKRRGEAEKAKEEAEKAKDQTEQDGYEAGVAETEEVLRVEILEICRYYCLQMWNETLNQAGVEASSTLRKAERWKSSSKTKRTMWW